MEKGTIFGFVAPMLAIIVVSKSYKHMAIIYYGRYLMHSSRFNLHIVQLNTFFLVMALLTLASARKRQIKRKKDDTFKARQELGRLAHNLAAISPPYFQ